MVTARACRRGLPAPAVRLRALLLTSCGPATTAAPSPPSTSTATGAGMGVGTGATTPAPPAARPGVTADEVSWDASGPSSGVDRAAWPDTPDGVRALLASRPKTLGGERLEPHIDPDDPAPGASYGDDDVVFVMTEEFQKDWPTEVPTHQMLQSGFGLGSVCLEGTQRGTIPVPELGKVDEDYSLGDPEPGVREGTVPGWFSCRSRSGEEPGPLEQAQAVGWTSGTTAWQLYARDEKAARTLVTALHRAAR